MISRREWLQRTMGAGGLLILAPQAFAEPARLITRTIPGTSEQLPIVGLGSSATFAQVARSDDVAALRAVLKQMVDLGGTVFDTAPSYGASEEVAGRMAQELGIADKLFWATKLNVAPRGGGAADPAAAREQLEASFQRIGKPVIDLVQVHNVGDLRTQLPILREYKEKGRIRYIGVTTTFEPQYAELVQTMRNEPIDFIGVDYAVDNRHAEERILPLARDQGIGVLVYAPFGRTRLWQRVKGREVPDVGARIRCELLGPVLPQIRSEPSSRHGHYAGHQPAVEHGGQHGRCHRPAAGCGHEKTHDPTSGGIAMKQSRREFIVMAGVAVAASALPLHLFAAEKMKIGIVGSGNVGSAIGATWVRAGHEVMFSSRDLDHDKALAKKLGGGARAGTPREAASFGEVVMVSVPYHALPVGRQRPRRRAQGQDRHRHQQSLPASRRRDREMGTGERRRPRLQGTHARRADRARLQCHRRSAHGGGLSGAGARGHADRER